MSQDNHPRPFMDTEAEGIPGYTGGPIDAEKDEVGFDVGAAGGGATAEELAMHEVPDPETGR